jgi:two-component system, LytTR family, response regulator
LRILIIEDEKVAVNRLREMLFTYDPTIEIVGVLDSVIDSVNFLINRRSDFDIIFMDIELSDGLCFEIFEEIDIDTPILFITAYDQYALKAFKVNSVDYLLKPIENKELIQSIEKFKTIHFNKAQNYQNTLSLIDAMNVLKNAYKFRFLIKTHTGFITVSINEVAYFYSEDKLSFLVTWENTKHIVEMALEVLLSKLDPKDFFKISRSFIVHHNSIDQINSHFNNRLKLQLKPPIDKEVFISRNNVKKFKEWLNN